ncbi:hypothetical protein OJAV_G00020830 [Oryzias javanicus]|uniref:Long-chain-fatty-acid--CoA ligase n=1 Tax=Oryzias javanicus TaxID=123683 RepID=A0A3S2N629_ORYJA|nr:hypothetical protein OJAV_G00020830 [Oryzias javanicus]
MIAYVLCTVLAAFAALLYLRNPYLLADLNYAINAMYVGYRLGQIQSRFYGFLDCFLDRVARHPDKKLIIFEDVSYTYKQADAESNKVARALSAHAQLKPGDTLGCVAALLNYNIRSRSLLHCFSCCGAKVLITSPDLREAVEEVLPTLREQGIRVFVLSDHVEADGFENLFDKIQKASDQPLSPELRANIHHKSPALYIYTSGTTGLPKAAIITHHRAWSAALAQEMVGVRSSDIFYLYLPLYHTAGFLMGLCGGINKGVTFVLKRKFSVSSFWDDCRKYNITVIQYIGEIMRYLCNTPKVCITADFQSLLM